MVPQYDTAQPKMISQGPSVCVFNKEDPDEVMASWLFAQYLLTNEVQCAYAQTEGYVPVTTKAHESDEYQAYLDAAGTDNDLHYQVKIDATKVLLENAENTTKSSRRKEKIDDAYLDALFDDVSALYHLDQIGGTMAIGDKAALGPLPRASIILIVCLVVAWIGIGAVALRDKLRSRQT